MPRIRPAEASRRGFLARHVAGRWRPKGMLEGLTFEQGNFPQGPTLAPVSVPYTGQIAPSLALPEVTIGPQPTQAPAPVQPAQQLDPRLFAPGANLIKAQAWHQRGYQIYTGPDGQPIHPGMGETYQAWQRGTTPLAPQPAPSAPTPQFQAERERLLRERGIPERAPERIGPPPPPVTPPVEVPFYEQVERLADIPEEQKALYAGRLSEFRRRVGPLATQRAFSPETTFEEYDRWFRNLPGLTAEIAKDLEDIYEQIMPERARREFAIRKQQRDFERAQVKLEATQTRLLRRLETTPGTAGRYELAFDPARQEFTIGEKRHVAYELQSEKDQEKVRDSIIQAQAWATAGTPVQQAQAKLILDYMRRKHPAAFRELGFGGIQEELAQLVLERRDLDPAEAAREQQLTDRINALRAQRGGAAAAPTPGTTRAPPVREPTDTEREKLREAIRNLQQQPAPTDAERQQLAELMNLARQSGLTW